MAQAIDLAHSTLAILAGGAGRRMGFAKSLLVIQDKPILQYLLEILNWPGPTLLVTAPGREHPPAHHLFDKEVVDPVQQGPLRGILTALEHCRTPELIVITVDMPAMRRHHLTTVLHRLSKNPELLGLMFATPDGRIEPFPFVSRTTAIEAVATHIASGKLAVHSLVDQDRFRVESAPSDWLPDAWTNLNDPVEYARFVSTISKTKDDSK